MYPFKKNLLSSPRFVRAFTMVEVVAALAVLSVMLSSVLVLMNRYAASVIDLQLRTEAFELARGNMEQLLAETKLSDMTEFGNSEKNPDIEWQTLVEPFYEPVTNKMWIRAICSAGFTDSEGEFQNIELEHWITNLTAAQVKQIVAQQQVETEYLDLLQDDEVSLIQETTRAYMRDEGLDYEAYDRFTEQQRRGKLEYISERGFDGYDQFIERIKDEENKFLEELGMDFDAYNEFAATYVPKYTGSSDFYENYDKIEDPDWPQDKIDDPESSPNNPDPSPPDPSGFDWSNVPPELVPLIESLLKIKKP